MVVVAGATPLNYLILINAMEVLPQLYGRVLVPMAVVEELKNPEAPAAVRAWVAKPPGWLEVRPGVQAIPHWRRRT
jgi:predicted nucleic acid-binding protein